MIKEFEIIHQLESGEFEEVIYDNESPWNSQSWTWVKFTNNDRTVWCGQFRGAPRKVALSEKSKIVLVLTSDYLFQLNQTNPKLINLKTDLVITV